MRSVSCVTLIRRAVGIENQFDSTELTQHKNAIVQNTVLYNLKHRNNSYGAK